MCVWGAGGNTRFSIFKDSLIILGHVRILLGIRLASVWRLPWFLYLCQGSDDENTIESMLAFLK